MKRRGQLFSLDALISLVIVILMLGTITSTSSSLKNEIGNMVGWYERANIADNMLDVLTKSPGEPSNWAKDPEGIISLGLADNSSRSLSFDKVKALEKGVEEKNPHILKALEGLVLGKDFSMVMVNGKWDFNVTYKWDPTKVFANLSDYQPWPESCVIAGSKTVELSAPTVVECDPSLDVRGSLHVVSDYSVCMASPLTGTGSVTWDIGHYPPANRRSGNPGLDEPYLAIHGDWTLDGSVTNNIEGDVVVYGAVVIVGGGSGALYVAGDLYVYGNSDHRPLIDMPSSSTYNFVIGVNGWSPGNLYVQYEGTWYAAISNPWSYTSWYKWTGNKWEQVSNSEFNSVILGNIIPASSPSGTVTINGYELPSEWNPPQPPCWNEGLPLDLENVSAQFVYPQNVSSAINSIASGAEFSRDFVHEITVINGSVVTDAKIINESLQRSPWVLAAERRTTVSILKYNATFNLGPLTKPKQLIVGALNVMIPYYYTLNITTPDENGNYGIFIVIDGSNVKVFGVWRTSDITMGGLWSYNETSHRLKLMRVYHSIGNSLVVPWSDLFSPFSENKGSKMVSLWAYKSTFSWLYLHDSGGIKPFMGERMEPFVIKLWVWDDS